MGFDMKQPRTFTAYLHRHNGRIAVCPEDTSEYDEVEFVEASAYNTLRMQLATASQHIEAFRAENKAMKQFIWNDDNLSSDGILKRGER